MEKTNKRKRFLDRGRERGRERERNGETYTLDLGLYFNLKYFKIMIEIIGK